MPAIRPFAALRYSHKRFADVSGVIAPPYDVLDAAGKARLLAGSEFNIVGVDLPHLPAKTLGPAEVYTAAAERLATWQAEGVLERDRRAAIYPFEQVFEHHGRTVKRHGFFALVRLSALGAGQVLPHERTHKGPIEDRLALMRATGMQLSPVFGLYDDPGDAVHTLLAAQLGRPEQTGVVDGVANHVWSVIDSGVEQQVIDFIHGRPVYIADGHHRYTTALHHQFETERANGGPLAEAHPANWCLFALVSTRDSGLVVWPTHRMVGNVGPFDAAALGRALAGVVDVEAVEGRPDEGWVTRLKPGQMVLYDGAERRAYMLTRRAGVDALAEIMPQQSARWRGLDLAVLHHYVLEKKLGPLFGGVGGEVTVGYTPVVEEAIARAEAGDCRLAVLVRATEVSAVTELARGGEVMPQKSTYFYPKVATGLVMAPLV